MRGALGLAMGLVSMLMVGPAAAQAQPAYGNGQAARPHVCMDAKKKQPRPCRDWELFVTEGTAIIDDAFSRADFNRLDKTFDQWSTGKDRFADGTWKLSRYFSALMKQFRRQQSAEANLRKIGKWIDQKPSSFAARYTEAVFWYAFAWQGQGSVYAPSVSNKEFQHYEERLTRANKILDQIASRANAHPSWYALKISVMLARGDGWRPVEEVFVEGVHLFPQYHEIYFSMALGLAPKWGGNARTYDEFAQWAAQYSKSFEGDGMYARLYWLSDCDCESALGTSAVGYPDKAKLFDGYRALMARYPTSQHNLVQFASVACRSNESRLYRQLRQQLKQEGVEPVFKAISADACDLRHEDKGKPI